jgi:hypothetical protein
MKMKLKKGLVCTTFSTRDDELLALPIGKSLCICAGFGLGDKILTHSLAIGQSGDDKCS